MNTNISNMNREQIAEDYMPLIYKVASQISKSSGYSYEECVGAGSIGLVYAIDNYKAGQGEKKQSFTQYAAYMIRFYILNDINAHGHVIRVNQNQQKELKESGRSIELTVSMDKNVGHDEDGACTLSGIIKGDDESSIYMSVDPDEEAIWKKIYAKLNKVFSQRDIDIFYSTFGLNDHEEVKGKDIAKKYGVSPCSVTQIRNKIINYMKKNEEMREMLLEVMQLMNRENY